MVKLEIIIIIYLANANLPNQAVDIWWDILGFHLCCCSFRGSVNDRVLPEVIPRVVGLRGGLSCCPPNLMSKCFAFQRWLTVDSVFAMSTSSREAGAGQGPGLLDTCHQHGRTCCWANFEYTLEQGWKDKCLFPWGLILSNVDSEPPDIEQNLAAGHWPGREPLCQSRT